MSWTTFHCENPDFQVRSIVDDVVFAVSRSALERSEVFRTMRFHTLSLTFSDEANSLGDMFACCDANSGLSKPQSMIEIHERSGELAALLRLLHDTPLPPAVQPHEKKSESVQFNPSTIIPLPLLKSLLSVTADKYALDPEIIKVLRAHLDAHASTDGLAVYGFASSHGLEWEACTASQYVLPVASYRFEEIKAIPNVIAYHKLVRLQDFRVKALRDLLLGEDLFPHGQFLPSQRILSERIRGKFHTTLC
jgi:hypothetical protein